jgi:phosphoglycolate phosphatase-like HAD superfamily hydrolase
VQPSPRGDAVVWDFDGTLVDSSVKNWGVSRAIIEQITAQPADTFEALASLAGYRAALARTQNWREFYAQAFGLSEADIDRAGGLWAPYQLRDATPTPLIAGIPGVLESLRHLPQGIVSQNARQTIAAVLDAHGFGGHFQAVIGFEEVDLRRQKPAPEGLLRCVELLTALRPGHVFYIGDHEADAVCAARAKAVLAERRARVKVVSIAALYAAEQPAAWAVAPDHTVRRPHEIVAIVARYTGPPPSSGT